VDGKYWGLSSFMYKSLIGRHSIGPTPICDVTWHSVASSEWQNRMISPLSIGQMINNAMEAPNVM
jgi:hypothetical protein